MAEASTWQLMRWRVRAIGRRRNFASVRIAVGRAQFRGKLLLQFRPEEMLESVPQIRADDRAANQNARPDTLPTADGHELTIGHAHGRLPSDDSRHDCRESLPSQDELRQRQPGGRTFTAGSGTTTPACAACHTCQRLMFFGAIEHRHDVVADDAERQ